MFISLDTTNDRIQKFDSNGNYITQWGTLGSSADGQFTNPHGVAAGPFCNVYVADTTNNRIQEFAGSCNETLGWTMICVNP